MRRFTRHLLIALSIAFAGCVHLPAHENLPAYPWHEDQAALHDLSERAHAVKTVSATALLTLSGTSGQSVRLDGAIVLSLPDRSVRIRTWKLGQAVFDLTSTPKGLWIETSGDSGRQQQLRPASLNASQLARALSIFGGEAFDGPDVTVIDRGGPHFQIRKPLPDGTTLTALIDRQSLVVRRYIPVDASNITHFRLDLADYREIQGIAWPAHLIAMSATGMIDVELRDVELNGELPPAAFVPPRRAEKVQ